MNSVPSEELVDKLENVTYFGLVTIGSEKINRATCIEVVHVAYPSVARI